MKKKFVANLEAAQQTIEATHADPKIISRGYCEGASKVFIGTNYDEAMKIFTNGHITDTLQTADRPFFYRIIRL